MSAVAFVEAVLGRHEAAAIFEVADPDDVLPRVASTWLSHLSDFEGHLPGTDVPAVVVADAAGWHGVLPGHQFSAAPLHYAAAAVAAALSPGGRQDANAVAAVGPTVDAVLAVVPTLPPVPQLAEQSPLETVALSPPPAARPRRIGVVRVSTEEARRPCVVCGRPQLRGQDLLGCACFASLLQAASVRRLHECFLVIPGPDWGLDAVASFAEAVRG